MKIFEPHIHMFSRTTDDYEQMALAGVRGICEPALARSASNLSWEL